MTSNTKSENNQQGHNGSERESGWQLHQSINICTYDWMEYLNGIGSKRFYRLPIEFFKNFITNALPISKPPFFPHILLDSLRSFYLGASFGCFIDKLHSQHQSYSVTILICSRAVTNKYCWLGSVSVAGLLFSFSLVRFFILGP